MKYTEDMVKTIVDLKLAGWSSREIASALGISKSGINGLFQRGVPLQYNPQEVAFKTTGPKVLIFDTETAAATALTFGRFKVNLSQDNILDNGGWILCACWRWLGEYETHSIYLTPDEVKAKDDSRIVAKLFELYEEADAVLAHNSLGFDHKVVSARALYNNFPPLPKVKVLDTLALAKKHFKLPSNRLDSIGEFLGLGRKLSTGGIQLWRQVQEGDVEAMQKMTTYCEQDVDLLYDIYIRLRPYGSAGSDYNAALYYNDDQIRCRTCGSTDVEHTGRNVTTSVSIFEEVRCNECGAVHRTRTSTTSKEKRKSLIV